MFLEFNFLINFIMAPACILAAITSNVVLLILGKWKIFLGISVQLKPAV